MSIKGVEMDTNKATIDVTKVTKTYRTGSDLMGIETYRRNIILPGWVENGLKNLAARKGVRTPDYILDLLKDHVKNSDCDDFGNLPNKKTNQ